MNFRKRSQRIIDNLPVIAQDADKIDTIFSATDFREHLIQLIDNATQRIYIVALYLQDDEAGREILTHLYEAKQKNPDLDIYVFVDWHRAQRGLIGHKESEGNVSLYKAMAHKYQHQIHLLGVPIQTREVLGVLHLKGSIIDDTVLYSGASINNIYLHCGDKYRCDRYHSIQNHHLADSMVNLTQRYFLHSAAVNSLTQSQRPQTKSIKFYIKQLRRQLTHAQYEFKPQIPTENQVGITPLIGVGSRHNRLNKSIKHLIATSHSQLVIFTPYFNLPLNLKIEIKKALKRGVTVDIITGDKTANDFYIPPTEPFKIIGALPYLYEVNLRNFSKINRNYIRTGKLNIHLWKNGNNSYHLKGVWVDKQFMLLTGNNLNPRAWSLDLENGMLIHDKHSLLQQQNEQEINHMLKNTRHISDYQQIENMDDYPEETAKFLKRITRVKVDKLVNRIL